MIHPINRYIIQDLLVPYECMAHQTNGIKVCSSISWNTTFHTFISWSPLITIPKNRWREELEKTYTIYVFESHDFFQGLLLRIEPTSLDGTAKLKVLPWFTITRRLPDVFPLTNTTPWNLFASNLIEKNIVNTEFRRFKGYLHKFLRLLKTHKKGSLTMLFSQNISQAGSFPV